MKKIQILGTGCKKCEELMNNTKKAVEELNIEAKIEKIEDIMEIMKFSVMMTPAIVVDGEVKSSGKVLNVEKIKEILNV